MRIVLDTSVLIDHLRGRPPAAAELIPAAIERGDELWSTYVVQAEVLAGMRAGEETATRNLFRLIGWVAVDETIAEAAGALGRQYLRSHPGIDAVDLIVAAVTQHLDAQLRTTNVKLFPMFPKLEAPY
jgi:predicted nucleic acid-binding protein